MLIIAHYGDCQRLELRKELGVPENHCQIKSQWFFTTSSARFLEFGVTWILGRWEQATSSPFFLKESVAKVLKFEKRKSFDKSTKSC
jgi:hypothetical protein